MSYPLDTVIDLLRATFDGSTGAIKAVIVGGSGGGGGEVQLSTSVITRISASVASVELLTADTLRQSIVFYNDSTAAAYVAFADTSSLTSFTQKLQPGASMTFGGWVYTNIVSCVWDDAVGAMQITEITV